MVFFYFYIVFDLYHKWYFFYFYIVFDLTALLTDLWSVYHKWYFFFLVAYICEYYTTCVWLITYSRHCRHGVVFHQDNAGQHVSVNMLQKLKGFGWDILNHLSYSPDMTPSDYYLFRSMEHLLHGNNFAWTISLHPNHGGFTEQA